MLHRASLIYASGTHVRDNISKFRATVITSSHRRVQFSNFPSHIRFLLRRTSSGETEGGKRGVGKGKERGRDDIANICGINNRGTKIHSKFETRSWQKEGVGEGKGRVVRSS